MNRPAEATDETTGSPSGGAAGAEIGVERIELSMPADPDLVALARMAASVVGSRIELSYEEVSDLRLAIDELVVLCGAGGSDGRVLLEFRTDDTGLRIDCSVSGGADPAADLDDPIVGMLPAQLSERILDALVDEHGILEDGGGTRRGWLWKRRPSH